MRWARVALGVAVVSQLSCGKPLPPIVEPTPEPAPRPAPPVAAPADPIPMDPPPSDPDARDPDARGGPVVRVAVASRQGTHLLGGDGAWRLLDARGGVVIRAQGSGEWTVRRDARRLRAMRGDGTATSWSPSLTLAAEEGGGALRVGAKRYRGRLRLVATDSGILAVNLVGLEEYLRGVVPLEIGDRRANERAAVEAQAIAARTYAVTRLLVGRRGSAPNAEYDLLSSVGDQVYGGIDAERPLTDQGVAATRGQVLLLNGRVVTAPFHSTCGGQTAAAEEVWRSAGEPHLRRVSDRIPGSDLDYCSIAPRHTWSRTLTSSELDASVARYLRNVATVARGGAGRVRSIEVDGRTPSGRVQQLVIVATNGTYRVRGNDARAILRTPAGEPLNSAYFSLTTEAGPDGRLARAMIRGTGYGHGVGMCQWGAIGRARAGQDTRAILRTYYPGTTVGQVPAGLLSP